MIAIILLASTCMSCAPPACPAGSAGPERAKSFRQPHASYVASYVREMPNGAPVVAACVAVQVVHVQDSDGHVDTLPALAILPCPDVTPAIDTTRARTGGK